MREDRHNPNNPAYECPSCGGNGCDCMSCIDCGNPVKYEFIDIEGRCIRCAKEHHAVQTTCYICSGNFGTQLIAIPWEDSGTHACPSCVIKEWQKLRTNYDALLAAHKLESELLKLMQTENAGLRKLLKKKG
jgi:hypothetical protein